MARSQVPIVITLSAREVVAFGESFRPRGEALHDVDVALDEISSLRAAQEPLVLRVSAVGGSKAERGRVEGDWLCDVGGSAPVRIPRPFWRVNSAALAWSMSRTWLQAWEECSDARQLLGAAVRVGVDRRVVVLAACDCVRTVLTLVPRGEARPLRAVEAAEAWARGQATGARVRAAADAAAAAAAAVELSFQGATPASHVARAAAYAAYGYASTGYSSDSQAGAAAAHVAYAADGPAAEALSSLCDVVRRRIPSVAVLRAAAV